MVDQSLLQLLAIRFRHENCAELLTSEEARRVQPKRKRPGNRGARKIQQVRGSSRDLGRLDLQKLAGTRDRNRPRLHGLRNLAHKINV